MKLNLNCMRDILLKSEEEQHIGEHWELDNFTDLIKKYSKDDVSYSLTKLNENDLIIADITYGSNAISELHFSGLTTKGHDFLDTIRKETNWEKTKKAAKKIGTLSIPIIVKIALENFMKNLS